MKVVFLGPPGAGKGTHAADFSKELSIPHISTGDIFRVAVKNETALGKEAKLYMDKGELVPDKLVVDVVMERLQRPDCEKGFILDGFPRSLPQAEILAGRDEVAIDGVIFFKIDKEIVLSRLTGRRLCRQCGLSYHIKNLPPKKEGVCDDCGGELYQRDDDKVETIEHRLDVYNNETKALIDYYDARKLLIEVNGNHEKVKGHEELRAVFEQLKA